MTRSERKRYAIFRASHTSFLVILVVGCYTAQPCLERVSPEIKSVAVYYSTGGLSPAISSVKITEDGHLQFGSLRGKYHCGMVSKDKVDKLFALVRDREVTESLRKADAAGDSYFDYESIEVHVGGEVFEFPTELIEPGTRRLLDYLSYLSNHAVSKNTPW